MKSKHINHSIYVDEEDQLYYSDLEARIGERFAELLSKKHKHINNQTYRKAKYLQAAKICGAVQTRLYFGE